jgi:branched-chain amino acid transport system substrate-binding protein
MMVTLMVGLSACDELVSILSTSDLPEMEGVQGDIAIGVVVPLTGKDAGPYGLSMKNGFDLALAEINSSQLGDTSITFITEDNMSTIEGTVAAFNKLIAQDVPAILGVALSSRAEVVFPIAQDNEVIAFSSVSSKAGLSGLGDYLFRTGLATDILNPAGVKASQARLGYTKVAIIYDEADAYSISGYEQFGAALAEVGAGVVTTQTIQTGETDFSEQLAAIMASDAEAVIISALAPEMVQIMSQGREAGIPSSVRYIVPDLTANEVGIVGDAAEGAITFINWIGTSEKPRNQAFIQNYRATYGIEPDPWAAQSYATLYILAAAISNAGSTDSTAIRDALAQTMDFDTILGPFSFDPNGEANYEPIIAVVKDGQIVMFEDSDMPSDDDMADDGMTDDGMMDDDMSDDDMTDDDMADDGMTDDDMSDDDMTDDDMADDGMTDDDMSDDGMSNDGDGSN